MSGRRTFWRGVWAGNPRCLRPVSRALLGGAAGFALATATATVRAETAIRINVGGGGGSGGSGGGGAAAGSSGGGGSSGEDGPGELRTACSTQELCAWIRNGNLSQVENVLKHKGVDVNEPHPSHGFTPLSFAVCWGRQEAVSLLLAHGADARTPDAPPARGHPPQLRAHVLNISVHSPWWSPELEGMTPLHYAVLHDDAVSAAALVAAGAREDRATEGSRRVTAADMASAPMLETLREAAARRDAAAKELRRRYPLEERLKEAIVGQLAPVHAVSAAVRRKQNGWHDPKKPLVFLFLGSSGIGKTELAKQLSQYLHPGDDDGFVRIDMSEYQHSHEVAKILGSPPGYVGHQEGGQLTAKLAKKPDAVVLFDEVEKAHPDLLTVLLQVFDEGRITDGKGKTIDCKDATFVMTSNLGQRKIADEAVRLRLEAAAAGQTSQKPTKIGRRFQEATMQPILRRAFKRDEFLGRINEVLFFLPFTDPELESLVAKELQVWRAVARERHSIDLSWTPEMIRYLKGGYNMRYGARSIKYEIDRSCIALVAAEHEAGRIDKGFGVVLDFEPDAAAAAAPVQDAAGGGGGGGGAEKKAKKAGRAGAAAADSEADVEGVHYAFPEGNVVLRTTPPPKKASWF